ncbi:MarP family serine protease [Corynebacterium felinum]|uniref:MarP family serine protease n=1 Tax=Corynebacterium felinum TaxID=131318 RepID=UPI0023FA3D41|nr:MarP family serine protease [Corynebacterium felinum]MDF5820531.1 MarP family serine protease [Corynebacterium felinum]
MEHSPGLWVDIIVALGLIVAIYTGWRQGAFASVLSTIGVIAGLICGAALAPALMSFTDQVALRFLLALGVMVLLVGLGNLIGGMLGSALRDRMRWRSSLLLDSVVGCVFQSFATLVVMWLVAIPLVAGLPGPVANTIRNSHILGYVDSVAPPTLSTLPTKISAMLSETGLPPLISPFSGRESVAVAAPAIEVEDVALVERLRPSVIHVLGESQACARRLMGSGFVVDNRHVITNAHVVAGTETVQLDTVLGTFSASVVFYDPQLDIAVLRSDELNIPPLRWAQRMATSGEDAIVMGFPESGPFEASPARVSDQLTIAGPDIYAHGRVEREAYTARGSIRQGNSGGPMLNLDGEVIGVVFGASADESDIGYALTAQEVQRKVGDLNALNTPVDTQECVIRG